jgi:NitT/TauT family transport system substrate-binding protein
MIFLKVAVSRGTQRASSGAKMKFSRIRTSAALLATATIALAAGCTSGSSGSSGGTATTTGHLEKTSITVGAVPSIDSAGLYIAQQLGFFRDQGLNVTIKPLLSSGGVTINEQVKGEYDITAGAYPPYILADAAEHISMRIVAEGSVVIPNGQEVIIPAGSKITSIAALKGKTIGVNASAETGSIATLLIDSVLQEHGISKDDVKFKVIPFPLMGQALAAHQVDAAFVPEPFISEDGQKYGDQELLNLDQGATSNFPILGYVVTQNWAKLYPNTLAAFLRALEQGQAVADTDSAELQKAMEVPAFAGVPVQTASIMGLANFPLTLDPVGLQRVANVMQQFGVIGGHFNITNMLG